MSDICMRYRDLPQEVKTPDNLFGVWSVVKGLGPVFFLVSIMPLSVEYVSPWTLLILVPLLGGAIHKVAHMIHECSHDTMFSSPRANKIVGWTGALLMGTRFDSFTGIHMAHHRCQGAPEDPQMVDYGLPSNASVQAVIWHLAKPLLGFSLFKFIQFNTQQKNIENSNTRQENGSAFSSLFSLILLPLLAIHLLVIALITGWGLVWWLAPVFYLAALTFGLFFSRVRSFVEHVNDTLPHEEFVRSHENNFFDWLFFFDFNFNYHVEHHRFPQVPAAHLPKIRQMTGFEYGVGEALSPSVWATVRMWFHRHKEQKLRGPVVL